MSAHSPEETQHQSDSNNGTPINMLLPLFLMIMLAAGAWYLLGMGTAKTHDNSDSSHDSHGTPATINKEQASVTMIKGKVDSLGNYMYEVGKIVTISLPNNSGTLEVGENSTENKLYKFLTNSTSKIDTVKGNWFEFTKVRFKTGSSDLDSASIGQLKNISGICKAFPNATFKIGGYTDNSGDSAKNVALSQKRADAVLAALKKAGTSAVTISSAKGYGPLYPLGDNTTEEGKAMNRRIAINVKAK